MNACMYIDAYMCMYICMYVGIYICIYDECMYVYRCIHVYVCMYVCRCIHMYVCRYTHTSSVNEVMRLIQYNSVLTFKLQIDFFPLKIVPLGGYTPPETLFPLFVTTLVVANRNRF